MLLNKRRLGPIADPWMKILTNDLHSITSNLDHESINTLYFFIRTGGLKIDSLFNRLLGYDRANKVLGRNKRDRRLLSLRKKTSLPNAFPEDVIGFLNAYTYFFLMEYLGPYTRRVRVYCYTNEEMTKRSMSCKARNTVTKSMLQSPFSIDADRVWIDTLVYSHATPIKVITYSIR